LINLFKKPKEIDFKDQNDHIRYSPKLIKTGKGATRETTDYQLSRFACYKIAMLGNTAECVQARTYFAIQTRKQEKFEELTEDQKRLKIRQDVTNHNKKLFDTAKNSGVTNFADFNDAGYVGLYGMRNKEIVKKKGLGKDNLLDRAGATELAANLFRITQTDEKLNNKNINSQTQSEKNS
jgi:DNA-damage-inducible protein D